LGFQISTENCSHGFHGLDGFITTKDTKKHEDYLIADYAENTDFLLATEDTENKENCNHGLTRMNTDYKYKEKENKTSGGYI
jgi:hypothetical protein